MAREELKKAINKNNLLRIHGFPFLMPIIKALHSTGDEVIIKQQLSTMINNHISQKYEKITTTTGIGASKADWRDAFLEVIDIDFLQKGYPREQIAWDWLKAAYPKPDWKNDTPYELECMGVDIFLEDYKVGISVKGSKFPQSKEYDKHIKQLLDNKFERTFIIYVDEKTKQTTMKEVTQ